MISVCCCAINAKWDVELFVEALNAHNDPSTFEICLCHDDRVQDGSREHFEQLQKRHPNLKIIRNTHEDTVDYLRKVMDHYDSKGIFKAQLRADLRANVEKFARKELFDHKRSFLWLTSGLLYNKAVSISSGDTLVITPADFLYLFRLADLEAFVKVNSRAGHFYAKPNAVWARLNNQDPEWLKNHVDEIHRGIGFREGYRWDSTQLFRDYLRYPPKLSDFSVPDFRHNIIMNLANLNWGEVYRFNKEAFRDAGVQCIPGFHGYHCMSRKTFDAIGGFTEEWPSRAFPDDKMTFLGRRFPPGHALPHEFSVAWCGQAELCAYLGPGYSENWREKLKEVDPLHEQHPIPSADGPTYLHQGLLSNSQMMEAMNASFNRNAPPVRVV